MHAHAACACISAPRSGTLTEGRPQRAVERLATASAGAPACSTTPAVEPHPLAAMATSLGSPAWVGVGGGEVHGCRAAALTSALQAMLRQP